MTGFFVDQGWEVAGCGRNHEELERLRSDFPSPHTFTRVDVADDSQVKAWAETLLAAGSTPDLIINSAALIAPNAPLWELPAEKIDPVVDVNLKGPVNVIRHFIPAMIKRGQGIIVNISSAWGRSTSPEVAVYCATKYAIEGITSALAQELPQGLAAVALNPGIINTDMLRSCFAGGASDYPTPEKWIAAAGPFLLRLSEKDNGRSLNVPGVPTE